MGQFTFSRCDLELAAQVRHAAATLSAVAVAAQQVQIVQVVGAALAPGDDMVGFQVPFSGTVNGRRGRELHQRTARAAAESGMSLNRWQARERSVSA